VPQALRYESSTQDVRENGVNGRHSGPAKTESSTGSTQGPASLRYGGRAWKGGYRSLLRPMAALCLRTSACAGRYALAHRALPAAPQTSSFQWQIPP